jgi:hypothetical protein
MTDASASSPRQRSSNENHASAQAAHARRGIRRRCPARSPRLRGRRRPSDRTRGRSTTDRRAPLVEGRSDLAVDRRPDGDRAAITDPRAYRHASGIEFATAATGSHAPARRFLLTLHNGTVTAEAFIGPRGLALVRRTGGPTFLRAAGARCWRRLGKEDNRTLLNVGAPFPKNGKVALSSHTAPRFAHPRQIIIETADGFWYLTPPVPSRATYKSFLTIEFNPTTYAIRSIGVRDPDPAVRATLTVAPLTDRPDNPKPDTHLLTFASLFAGSREATA